MASVIVLLHGATTLVALAETAIFGFVYVKFQVNALPTFCFAIVAWLFKVLIVTIIGKGLVT